MDHFSRSFGYFLWESLLERDTTEIQQAIDLFFPPTRLPNGAIRRSSFYRSPSTDFAGFSNTTDLLWRSADMQQRIFEHQHPPTCEGRSLAQIQSPWKGGFGSQMHFVAGHLSEAIDRNEILVYPRIFASHGTDSRQCGARYSMNCYFEPLSNCTPGPDSRVRISRNDNYAQMDRFPRFVAHVLNGSVVDPQAFLRYWWDHALAYCTRLNLKTRALIDEQMEAIGDHWNTGGFDVAIHIRHGDKASEMELVDDINYLRVVELLRKLEGRNLTVYLATDDPASFEFFQRQTGIAVFGSRSTSHELFDRSINYLRDIVAPSRAKYQIGTYGSNGDRWMKALATVNGQRSSNLFFEVGYARCLSVAHCRAVNLPFPRF
jgi:hypothetical protein